MAGILIIAHVPLASALRDCIVHFYGDLPPSIGVLDVTPDCDPVVALADAHAQLQQVTSHNGALVLTDMFGATPTNIAVQLAALPHVRVVTGVNLPMLVRAVCYRTLPTDKLAEKALQGAANGIHSVVLGTSSTAVCVHSPVPQWL
ncbi:PTS sugar transporter subunit IIA [Candidatus Vallotia cooleyia]|uniref:PTS sugar transporter subunit IIA n=1 Tax=Candidatus Vallotiella adelgis TaxID=1177211 RepID=UPI001D0107EB|nr:PTS sugar transporter subunit IIB [Candidatus Vallotia cooleyia]